VNSTGHDSEHAFAINLMNNLVVPTFVLNARCEVIIWNLACERLTGVPFASVQGTSEHWRAFYDQPRPCLADLIIQERTPEISSMYAHQHDGDVRYGLSVENWCVMPQAGTRLYLAINAGPIYNKAGELIAVVETLRDMTVQKEAQVALERLASHDALTGIANRRNFDETLEREWRRCRRDAQSLALLMLDVDYFKPYNDTFGHPAGDVCLQRVAQALAQVPLRASDLVARYGGEEFAVILPNASLQGAREVAERLRAAVWQMALPGVAAPVSVSIGVACLPATPEASPEQLMALADAALYRAKHEGRNRVC
jgi:diguanylate cyclase (GGDEF)-like protein